MPTEIERRHPALLRAIMGFRAAQAAATEGATGEGEAAEVPRARVLDDDVALEALLADAARAHVDVAEAAATAAHVADYRAARVLAAAREVEVRRVRCPIVIGDRSWSIEEALDLVLGDAPRSTRIAAMDALVAVASEVTPAWDDARARAEDWARRARALGDRHPDRGPSDDAIAEVASLLLRESDSLVAPVHDALSVDEPTLPALVGALSRVSSRTVFSRRERLARLAVTPRALRLARELDRVRVSADASPLGRAARAVAVDAPRVARLVLGATEHGLVTELAVAEGVGRALAHALVSVGHPFVYRHSVVGSSGRTLGGLLAGLYTEPRYVERALSLPRVVAGSALRVASAWLILRVRWRAAAVLAGAAHDSAAMLSRALGVEVPAPLAALAIRRSPSAAHGLRGSVAALALHVALRDRFDEDWYANPRVEEVIRAMVIGGGATPIEATEKEYGAHPASAIARLRELASRDL